MDGGVGAASVSHGNGVCADDPSRRGLLDGTLQLLYLVHRAPIPPNRGDRIRSYHVLRFLAARADVHLACLADEPVPADQVRLLNQWCARVAVVPLGGRSRWLAAAASLARGRSLTAGLFHSRRLRQTLIDWSRETRFDLALAFCSSVVPYLDVAGLAGVPAVVDLVDVDSQKWFDYAQRAAPLKRAAFRLEGHRVRQLEQRAARRARALLVVSEPEAALCRQVCPSAMVHTVSNGVDLQYFGAAPAQGPRDAGGPECVFVGALDYRANIEGVTWFCQHVWPQVRERYPGAMFTLVGRKPAPAVAGLASLAGVNVVGSVPDVRPYLWRATVAVAPLLVARGIQNKVLEALAAQQAVVATPQALEGLDLVAGEHAWCAESPPEWVVALSRLFDDPPARCRLAANGRSLVERRYSWPSCLAELGALLGLRRHDEAPSLRETPPPSYAGLND